MYNINDVYNIVLYFCSKNLQQGYISPSDFNNSFNIAQKSYAAFLLGNLEQYRQGRPVAPVEFGQNTVVRQRLTPIIYGYNLTVDTTGFSPYPGDYLQTDAMWSIYGYNRIREVQQNYFYSIYGSVIDRIPNWPVYMIEDVGFRFFPNEINQAKLNYVRNPPNAVWGYTDDENGLPVYSAARSTQPVWDDASIMEIIVRQLRIIGVNLSFGDVSQYANEIKQLGQ